MISNFFKILTLVFIFATVFYTSFYANTPVRTYPIGTTYGYGPSFVLLIYGLICFLGGCLSEEKK